MAFEFELELLLLLFVVVVVDGAREKEDCSGFVAAGLAGVGLVEVVAVLLDVCWGVLFSAEARRKARLPLRRRGRMAEDIMRVMTGVGGENCPGFVC